MTEKEATDVFFNQLSPLAVQLEGEVLEMGGAVVGGLIDLLEQDTEYFGDVVKAAQNLIEEIRRVEGLLHLIPDADE